MFERNELLAERVEMVIRITEDLNRGQVLTHGEITQVLGVLPHEGDYDTVVTKVRAWLLEERRIATRADRTVGYKLLTEEEQIGCRFDREKKVGRQKRMGLREVQSLPVEGLSLHQRRRRAFEVNRGKDEVQKHLAQMKADRAAFKPTPVLPRRPPSLGLEN